MEWLCWSLSHRLMKSPFCMGGCCLSTIFTVKTNISEVFRPFWKEISMIQYKTGGKAKSVCDVVVKSLELKVVSLVGSSPGGRQLTSQG